jgi:hypothetical protein
MNINPSNVCVKYIITLARGIITLTKQPQDIEGSGLTPRGVAGAPEIPPASLAAGVHVIVEEWGICGDDIAADLARDVFNAMWVALRKDREPIS